MQISVHDIESIHLETITPIRNDTCFYRVIVLTDAKGNRHEITLFTGNAESLKVQA